MREFGGRAEAPMHRVMRPAKGSYGSLQNLGVERVATWFECSSQSDMFGDVVGAAVDFAAACFPGHGQRFQQAPKRRPAMSVLRRKVGPAVEWFEVGRQEDRHGPAPLPGQKLHG